METQTEQVVSRERALRENRAASRPETVWPEEQRKRLMAFLASTEPAWKDEDHPELVELGTYGWVRSQREKSWRSPEVYNPSDTDPERQ